MRKRVLQSFILLLFSSQSLAVGYFTNRLTEVRGETFEQCRERMHAIVGYYYLETPENPYLLLMRALPYRPSRLLVSDLVRILGQITTLGPVLDSRLRWLVEQQITDQQTLYRELLRGLQAPQFMDPNNHEAIFARTVLRHAADYGLDSPEHIAILLDRRAYYYTRLAHQNNPVDVLVARFTADPNHQTLGTSPYGRLALRILYLMQQGTFTRDIDPLALALIFDRAIVDQQLVPIHLPETTHDFYADMQRIYGLHVNNPIEQAAIHLIWRALYPMPGPPMPPPLFIFF